MTQMEEACSPFRYTQPPDNLYITPFRKGVNQFVTGATDQARPLENAYEKEEEASLGGQIVSPRNAD